MTTIALDKEQSERVDIPMINATLRVNGKTMNIEIQSRDLLLDVLRDQLGLTGPKRGCNETVCGACAVLVDGRAICSCTMLALETVGAEITTIEGLSGKNEQAIDLLQSAFVKHDSLQCAFCTAGQMIAAKSFVNELRGNIIPSETEIKEALSGNLCRCGCYNKIVEAVAEVVAATKGQV
jgi:aerobic-type carbon monoxide dehydrogenase small subunit (CoxS/CutS family)